MELTISGLYKIFYSNGNEPTFKLELPELKFRFGSVNYIMGQNGSGKSVFLKLLSGEMSPTNSTIKIHIGNRSFSPKELEVAIVRQKVEENLCLELSVEENLLLRLPAKSIKEKLFPKKYLRKQVINSLNEHSGLKNKLNQVCSELSGGQKQSLAFYSSTAQKSKVLCLDEFLSSTDFNTSQSLRQKAKQYAAQNNSCVIIVSHDLEVALEDAERIFVLDNGKLKCQIDKGTSDWNKNNLIKNVLVF